MRGFDAEQAWAAAATAGQRQQPPGTSNSSAPGGAAKASFASSDAAAGDSSIGHANDCDVSGFERLVSAATSRGCACIAGCPHSRTCRYWNLSPRGCACMARRPHSRLDAVIQEPVIISEKVSLEPTRKGNFRIDSTTQVKNWDLRNGNFRTNSGRQL